MLIQLHNWLGFFFSSAFSLSVFHPCVSSMIFLWASDSFTLYSIWRLFWRCESDWWAKHGWCVCMIMNFARIVFGFLFHVRTSAHMRTISQSRWDNEMEGKARWVHKGERWSLYEKAFSSIAWWFRLITHTLYMQINFATKSIFFLTFVYILFGCRSLDRSLRSTARFYGTLVLALSSTNFHLQFIHTNQSFDRATKCCNYS